MKRSTAARLSQRSKRARGARDVPPHARVERPREQPTSTHDATPSLVPRQRPIMTRGDRNG